MAEIVNLRMARKRKARAGKEQVAEANRLAHGIARTERLRLRAEIDKADAAHAGHRLEKPRGEKA